MRPIFHLSIPVRGLDESVAFYTAELGAEIGRRESDWADMLIFGAQLTLQRDPANVSIPMPRTRHFGATIGWSDWELIATRLGGSGSVIEPPTRSYEGEEVEQAKMMISDPSGNRIEIKAYRNPAAVLGSVAET